MPGLGAAQSPNGKNALGSAWSVSPMQAGQTEQAGPGGTPQNGNFGGDGGFSGNGGFNGSGFNGSGGFGGNGTDTGQGPSSPPPPKGNPLIGIRLRGSRAGGRRRRSFWRELPVLIVIALVLALVIKTYAIQAFFIPSASMENTLEIGDRVLINKVVYHLRPIHRGDIVVFDGTGSWDFNQPPSTTNIFSKAIDELEGIVGISHDSSIYIKRVIGLPGDRVACCNAAGQVTVNGVALTEGSYLYPGNSPSLSRFNITVPADRLWVMGDHRAVSYDSRGHMGDPGNGTIPQSAVLGRAFVIIWPPSRWGILNIPATFEQPQLNSSSAAAGGSTQALAAALANGTPIKQAATPLPILLGFAGALPLTWLQRTVRRRLPRRRPGSSTRQDPSP
jgi:signal peptidase I